MHSVYRPSVAGNGGPAPADSGGDRRAQLEGVVRLGRAWLERMPAADPQREHLIRMGILAEDLIRAGDYSVDAMTTARALLCANCRRLDASQGKCRGQALDRCMLLNGTGP